MQGGINISTTIENNIADNTEISAQTLNNIAADLGKPDFSTFSDGQPFAVDYLNLITAELAGEGIIPGLKNEFKVTLSDGKITVSGGVGILKSGMKIRLENPVTLDYSGESYLYFKYDSFTNSITLNLTAEEETGDYILNLAEISPDGKITDKRRFSQGKCSPVTRNFTETHTIDATYTLYSEEYQLVDSIELSYGGYRGFTITALGEKGEYTVVFGYSIQSGEEQNCCWVSGERGMHENVDYFHVDAASGGGYPTSAQFRINGNRLDVYLKKQLKNSADTVSVKVKIEMF